MSPSVSDLIGRIIHPAPRSGSSTPSRPAAIPAEPLDVLIGRIIAPPGPRALTVERVAPAKDPVPQADPLPPPPS